MKNKYTLSLRFNIPFLTFIFLSILNPCYSQITMKESQIIDKIKGGWVGQMAGVAWGYPLEFKYLREKIPTSAVPIWSPADINDAFDQDDLYCEIPFLDAMRVNGVTANWQRFGDNFRDSKFQLWHANFYGRKNLLNGIQVPLSGHYSNSSCVDDIDWQIEADWAGLMSVGHVNAAIDLSWRAGHVMCYGDGVYGGVFVSAMYAQAYTATSINQIIETGMAALPDGSKYKRAMQDVINWKNAGNTWDQCWNLVEQSWWANDDRCVDEQNSVAFNIDAKLNGAYVLMGLLYGNGDLEASMLYAMRCGQDADCNPSTVGGILGSYMGLAAMPTKFKSGLNATGINFSYTNFNFNEITDLNFTLSRELVLMRGGSINGTTWTIPSEPVTAPILEQWPATTNVAPQLTANIGIPSGLTVQVTAAATDADGIKAYQWHFGDFGRAYTANASHAYTQAGTYQIICYVTDNIGNTSNKSFTVTLSGGTTTTTIPLVTTNAILSIASTTASSGGNVTIAGSSAVTVRGVVWSTTANPTVTLTTKTVNGSGTGTFTSSITGLTAGTTYNVRAYATNSAGTSYGSNVVFTATTESGSSVSIYPNPATSVVTVDFGQNLGSKQALVEVLDMQGRKVYTSGMITSVSTLQLNTSEYSKGVYLIRISRGTESVTKKVMIE